ncbi:MAG: family penicillin-binding protein [Paenibacillus sp.]|uniref:transglycosylase domain-containing protein n=1 Tax=Paenibacillus sp. GCM10012303 TaxID=3317340 RepID=UPI0029EA9467|nr:family penicillin-binding protein [Paenibacillus sp.]
MNRRLQPLANVIRLFRGQLKHKRKSRSLPRFRISKAAALVAVVSVCGSAALGAIFWVRSLDISKLANPLLAPTQLIDKNGGLASEISSSKIVPVPLERIPLHLQHAIVAVEDKRFYDHAGVDAIGILRALMQNLRAGGVAEGGSTITQQLAKNMFLSHDQTLSRKVTEAGYAFKIEQTYDKERILETYLNQIYFGEGQWGIQKAANTYFGKDVADLTLPESAMLAALPKAPTHYSPFKNKEKALERRNLVLDLMLAGKYIGEDDHRKAIATPVVLAEHQQENLRSLYPYYMDQVIEEAIELYGFTERQLLAGGLRIYTRLDPAVQAAMDKAFGNDSLFPKSAPDQLVQSGAVILDPYTGGVLGLVGGRGEHVFRGFNRATQLKRQPGSSFKPLVVYAPALEQGYGPHSRLYDGPLDINGYRPTDWDKRTRGEVTMREAIIRSWNIPPVWLLNEIGLQTGQAFVQRLGIPLAKGDNNLAIALGGLQEGVSPLQMAQAFGAFPNLGSMMPAHTIEKITTADGRVLAEAKPSPVAVMSPSTAFAMTGMLLDAVREGTGSNAALNRPTAGKSGTTQLPSGAPFEGIEGGTKDAWFVGYTPELVGAVWIGYDQTDRNHYLNTSGGYSSAIVFREMMSSALQDVPAKSFRQPPEPGKRTDSFVPGKGNSSKDDEHKKEPPGQKKKEEKEKEKEKEKEEKRKREEEKRNKDRKPGEKEDDDDD